MNCEHLQDGGEQAKKTTFFQRNAIDIEKDNVLGPFSKNSKFANLKRFEIVKYEKKHFFFKLNDFSLHFSQL